MNKFKIHQSNYCSIIVKFLSPTDTKPARCKVWFGHNSKAIPTKTYSVTKAVDALALFLSWGKKSTTQEEYVSTPPDLSTLVALFPTL